MFWKINIVQLSQFNVSLVDLVSEFYFLIPEDIYALGAWLFLITIAFAVLNNYFRKKYSTELVRAQNGKWELLRQKKINHFFVSIICLLMIFALNFAAVHIIQEYKQKNNDQHFTRVQFFSDLSIYGFFIHNALNQAEAYSPPRPEVVPKVAAAQKIELPKTDIEIIKDSLANLSLLSLNNPLSLLPPSAPEDLPHIIIFQMESVSSWALRQDPSPMPFLQKLMDENFTVDHFFANSCTTINAEFSSLCSFLPDSFGPISDLYSNNKYYCLPHVLNEKYGYENSLYHANTAEFWNRDILGPGWGFEKMYFSPYFFSRQSDDFVLKDMVEKIKIAEQPTFNYVIGFTSHAPHNEHFQEMNLNENNLEIKPYEFNISEHLLAIENQDEQTIRLYFGFLSAVDQALENLFGNLEKENLLDNTIVAIFGDHRYYYFNSGNAQQAFYGYNELPFVLHVPQRYKRVKQSIASHVDIAPTILHLLGGNDYQMPENFIGQSMLSSSFSNQSISKCLGEILYVNQSNIIKKDMLLDTYKLLATSKPNASMIDYITPLDEIISLSDKMLREDALNNNAFVPGANENNLRTMEIDEITDSDQDGLSDLREKGMGTDSKNFDSDGDGYLDGDEIINGYDPLGPGRLAID